MEKSFSKFLSMPLMNAFVCFHLYRRMLFALWCFGLLCDLFIWSTLKDWLRRFLDGSLYIDVIPVLSVSPFMFSLSLLVFVFLGRVGLHLTVIVSRRNTRTPQLESMLAFLSAPF